VFDPLSSLNPNDTFHLILYAAGVNALAIPFSGPIRFAGGPGLLFGVAPTATQLVRLSIGGTALFGEWARDGLGGISMEPRVRASLNVATLSIVPIDLYVEGIAPYFFESNTATAGFGGGFSARVFSVPVDVGADYVFGRGDFGEAATPAPGAFRFFASGGFDFLASAGIGRRTGPQQIRVDLRCDLLAQAREMVRQRSGSYCSDVTKALDGAYADRDASAMERFLALLPQELGAALGRIDTRYGQCLAVHRRRQRVCVDCTGKTISYWFTYTVDPHQIAAALGCIPGVNPDDARCPEADESVAREHRGECD
jgi:hypothetical protein